MNDLFHTTVICQDPGDGSGDVVIELSSDVLASLGVRPGDSLSIGLAGESIVLKPICSTDTQT